MAKKENLPMNIDLSDQEPGSNIVYSNEVVSIIAGVAASEVEGIATMVNAPNGRLLGKNRNVTRGVKVEIGTEEASVDLYVTVEYGKPIQKVAQDVQEVVHKAIEEMTGLHVVRVDVHVQGVSFEKENSALSAGAQNAALDSADVELLKEAGEPKSSPKANAKSAAKAAAKSAPEGMADA